MVENYVDPAALGEGESLLVLHNIPGLIHSNVLRRSPPAHLELGLHHMLLDSKSLFGLWRSIRRKVDNMPSSSWC